MYLLRAIAVWLVIMFAESLHGTLRQLFLAPAVGDFPARRIAFFSGMLVIFLIACIFIRWIAAPSFKSLFAVGLLWAVLTLFFEFGLGRLVFNYSYERLSGDYNVSRGGLMGFGLVVMVFVPFLAAKVRGEKTVF